MKKIFVVGAVLLCTLSCFAQKDVTKFLGIPVDGPKSEMIKNLKSKGFKVSNTNDADVLTGRFNGHDVNVYISTENNKVSRITVIDENTVNETDIKVRFNRLCRQFKDNGKYASLDDYTIPENEDISYEMNVHNKRYEAIFYQLPEEEVLEKMKASVKDRVQDKFSPSQLESPTEEIRNEIFSLTLDLMMDNLKNKPVWFMISDFYGKYFITMFYDNEYNRANGEDL
ncbi:MAG: hypothetical protein K2M49_02230 [Muribaculaceae bacterium]|nr:hypothetical protein [Muribaculaceae bacterium]